MNFPPKRQWRRALMFSSFCAWTSNRITGDMKLQRAQNDGSVMIIHCSHMRYYAKHSHPSVHIRYFSCTASLDIKFDHLGWFSISWIVFTHDDVIKWKHFPRCWPFVRGIHRSPDDSPHEKPQTQSFDDSPDVRLNKGLNKWWICRWLKASWCPCDLVTSL